MRLNLGSNIRHLRKNANLTQEQLADKLGVSYQSVSRWENGTTYPDMELIPSLAGIFGVSTDILFGMPEQEKESAAARTLKELVKASLENPVDAETVNCLIRDIRRNYLGCKCLYQFWFEVNKRTLRMPEILPEIRLTAETILNGNYDTYIRNTTIQQFSSIKMRII